MSKSLGLAAISYAEKYGFHVFPLKERSKLPATSNGFYDASNIPTVVISLWEHNPNLNIGLRCGPESGVWVLDIDGDEGEKDLIELQKLHGQIPKTATQITGKGRHLIFKYPKDLIIPNRAKLIRHDSNQGLDVRGNGGYIVLAPSIHPDGSTYKWLIKPSECLPIDAPQWLLDMVIKAQVNDQTIKVTQNVRFTAPIARLAKRNSPQDIIDDQLSAVQNAPEGTRNHTLVIAAMKVGKVIEAADMTEGEAKNLLTQAALNAGLDQSEIGPTIRSGFNFGITQPYKYGQSKDSGTYSKTLNAPKNVHDEDGVVIDEKPLKFNLLPYNQLINGPRVQWLIDGIFPVNSFGTIYGVPGSYKTFAALDMALSIAYGIQWHGMDIRQGNVLYIAGEGLGGLGKRLKAWTYQNAPNEPEPPFYAITANVNFRNDDDVNELIRSISSLDGSFSAIFIDTVARAIAGSDENDAMNMGLFVAACDYIKDLSGSSIIGIHHSGKDPDKGMRGSTALLGAVDTVLQVSVDDSDCIVLKMEKQKDSELIKDMVFEKIIVATGITETSVVLTQSNNEPVYQKIVSKKKDMALQFLWDCISDSSENVRGIAATTIAKWREACDNRELGGDTLEAKKKSFMRAKKRLMEEGFIACERGLVWCLEKEKKDD